MEVVSPPRAPYPWPVLVVSTRVGKLHEPAPIGTVRPIGRAHRFPSPCSLCLPAWGNSTSLCLGDAHFGTRGPLCVPTWGNSAGRRCRTKYF